MPHPTLIVQTVSPEDTPTRDFLKLDFRNKGLDAVNILVRLSLLTMTNPNQLCGVLLFVCSKRLLRPISALNCLLQREQERSEEALLMMP